MGCAVKVADLTGAQLDYWVAKAEGFTLQGYLVNNAHPWRPATDWAQGGPVIEREGISVQRFDGSSPPEELWNAYLVSPPHKAEEEINGPTPLVAAMRCYVTFYFGPEVSD